ncbi:MAG: hypothetical protein MZV63_32625 [Marinilabiliales bacterium]|nr:hypothetical protein [Marinilabiliales bacterium]
MTVTTDSRGHMERIQGFAFILLRGRLPPDDGMGQQCAVRALCAGDRIFKSIAAAEPLLTVSFNSVVGKAHKERLTGGR